MQNNSFCFYSGCGSDGKNCSHETAQKPEENQDNVGKAETETEAKKEVVIPATAEKIKGRRKRRSRGGKKKDDAIAAPLGMLETQFAKAKTIAQDAAHHVVEEARKQSPTPQPIKTPSSRDSGERATVDDGEKSNANAVMRAAISAFLKSLKDPTLYEKAPLQSGNLNDASISRFFFM